jgi:hypothetical protein
MPGQKNNRNGDVSVTQLTLKIETALGRANEHLARGKGQARHSRTAASAMEPARNSSMISRARAPKAAPSMTERPLPAAVMSATTNVTGKQTLHRSTAHVVHQIDPVFLVFVRRLDALERLDGAQECNTAARQDAFLDRGAGRMHRVIDPILTFLDLDLGRTADAERYAAGKLRQPLLQLLAIVVGGGLFDLRFDLGNAGLDISLFAGATDDRGILLVDHHLLGAAHHVKLHVLKLDAEILGDCGAAGQHSDVLQHGFAAITKAGSLDGGNLETAAQLINDESRERLTFDVFRNDEQRFAGLYY